MEIKHDVDGMMVIFGGNEEIVSEISTYSVAPILHIGKKEWYIFKSRDEACTEARKYWEDMAQDSPKEFAELVGTETLVSWALGQWAGPGNEHAQNLDGWLDIVYEHPEEEWGRYDGRELEVDGMSEELRQELNFDWADEPVMYRCN